MITNGDITLYHTDDDWETCTRHFFDNVSIFYRTQIAPENGGMRSNSTLTIRIPTEDEIQASTGDYIYIGDSADERPDKTKCRKIMSVTDNRRGSKSMQHWRLSL